ncbi:unnamed protein product [Oppiella nova]|uniref:Glucose-methanol-choline oxidoreductase N-terminal domain-containing protein n=1 Tax=Oppiella nova TaxID=334625 RepID=A0A7R9QQH8_9ACAR|nr:unnamed protein product [Oppiella nova]CAG2171754.1 unnamed protein product [Oppiella nova]
MHTNYNRITDQTNAEPMFIIAKQSDIPDTNMRTLFAIQNAKMANDVHNDRIKWVNLGLMKFGKLFSNTAVALFTFVSGAGPDIKNVHPWTTGNNLRTLPRSTETTESLDFETILANGITLFNDRDNGGTFIIVIGGPGIKTSNKEREFASPLFQTAASVTSGRVVYVREDSSAARTAHQFVKAFGALSDDYQIIDEKYVENSGDNKIDFEINVDSTLMGKTVRVYFMRTNTVSTETTLSNVKLQVPTGRPIDMNFISINNYFEGCVFTTTSDDLSGKWHLTATRDVSKSESVVAVVEVVTDSVDDESITAQCWLNTQVFNPRTDKNRPVMAYVNIHRQLDELIANVSVKMSVIYEKGNQPKTINMYDDGSGAPDITKGDGIFSNYITNIGNQGYWTVGAEIANIDSLIDFTTNFGSTSLPKTSADSACCGSRVDGQIKSMFSVTKLSRKLECGTLFVTDNDVSREYPPNPVRDLRAESVAYENRTINLLWTAPGGDYTSGYTDKYVIKAFRQNDSHEEDEKLLQEIRTKFDDLAGADISVTIDTMADGYGKEQRCQIRFNTDTGGVYYVALRAYDTDKHPSVVSNVVLAYIKSNVIIQSTTAFANDVSIYQAYRSVPQIHVTGVAMDANLGKAIGGSSTINGMLYNRGNKRDYDNWADEYGAKGRSYEEILPYFIKSENNSDYKLVGDNPGYHGTNGPIDISSDPSPHPILSLHNKALNEFGIQTIDVNGPEQLGTTMS